MTKKILLFIIALLFIIPFSANASHYMGGEITWECMPNGNYRFTLKMYRECNGISFYSNNKLDVEGHPTVSSINMTLISQTDISPKCNSNLLNIDCNNTYQNNTGAIEEFIWTSDTYYPNGVNLPGVPPVNGWVFYNSAGDRNPCSNIYNSNSKSWYLRATMHNYNGRPAGVCDDNSPTFLTTPSSALSAAYPYTILLGAQDQEFDSLSYNFIPALGDSITDTLVYNPGYSFYSPLPSTLQNPSNIPANLNQNTGELDFTSFSAGAYVVSVSVKAYKQQQLAAEIIREFQVVILWLPQNNQPIISAPFLNSSGYQVYADTVIMGDIVNFNITGIDTDSITIPSGTVPQTVTITAYGTQFDTNYISQGCKNPPCATLSPSPNYLSAPTAVTTNFNWQTSTNHITSNLSQSYDRFKNVYNFIFVVQDDFCPIPKLISKNVTVTIVPRGLMPAPQPRSTEVLINGDVEVIWEKCDTSVDNDNTFESYIIYHSDNKQGPYTALDTLSSPWISNTSFIHQGADAHNLGSHYYYLRTISFIQDSVNSFRYMNETPSDTIALIKVEVFEEPMCDVRIEWDDISMLPLNINYGGYYIYKTDQNGISQLLDSTYNNYYIDITTYMPNVKYSVSSTDTSGFFSLSPKKEFICTHASLIESENNLKINIFPNPAQNTINFEQYSKENISMELYNINGKLITSIKQLNKGLTTINISNLASGIYFVKFESESDVTFKKVVVE